MLETARRAGCPVLRQARGPPLLRTPLELDLVTVIFMGGVSATQFEFHAGALNHRVHPAHRFSLAKNIGNRRQVNQVNTTGIGLYFPGVSVTVHVRFDLSPRTDDLK